MVKRTVGVEEDLSGLVTDMLKLWHEALEIAGR